VRLLTTLSHTALALLAAYEFPTLFGLILIEEMGVPLPLPGDMLIAYAGGRPGRSPLDAMAIIGTVALATAIGSSLLFLLARRYGPWMVGKAHRVLHLRPERVTRMQVWFRERGAVAIVLGRLIPGLRTPTSVMAGLARVPYRVFAPSTMLAAIIWAAFYYYAGDTLHRLWSPLTTWAGEDPEQAISVIVFAVGLVVVWRWLRQRKSVPHRHQQMDRLTP